MNNKFKESAKNFAVVFRVYSRLMNSHLSSKFIHAPSIKGETIFIEVYADKTKLSSFGTVKGYPVMIGLSNLAMHIRNGAGIGSGRIVGLLPVVRTPSLRLLSVLS